MSCDFSGRASTAGQGRIEAYLVFKANVPAQTVQEYSDTLDKQVGTAPVTFVDAAGNAYSLAAVSADKMAAGVATGQ